VEAPAAIRSSASRSRCVSAILTGRIPTRLRATSTMAIVTDLEIAAVTSRSVV
jgi:hypothetical protein